MSTAKRAKIRNLVQIDHARLDEIANQIPQSYSIIENLKIKFGISLLTAKMEVEASHSRDQSPTKRIRKLESYLDKNGLLNRHRPRRMPHRLGREQGFWWVKETFKARKVIIPSPALLERVGILALTIWIAEPKRAPVPKDRWDWTGSFLYLPTAHYEKGLTETCMSGCSALQFIVNAAQDHPLLRRDWKEPFGRNSAEHPIEKLVKLGAYVSDEQRLESLYYVRYITDEQVYSRDGIETRINDIVGYPIYISAI